MAGFRIGTLYSENRDIVEALAKLGSFHGISGTTQHQVAQLLQDRGTVHIQVSADHKHCEFEKVIHISKPIIGKRLHKSNFTFRFQFV